MFRSFRGTLLSFANCNHECNFIYVLQDWCRKSKTFTPVSGFEKQSLCVVPFRNWEDWEEILHFTNWEAWCNVNIIDHLKCIVYHMLCPLSIIVICILCYNKVLVRALICLLGISYICLSFYTKVKKSTPQIPFRCYIQNID